MQRPGFWDDQAKAAEISAQHARAQKRLEGFRALTRDVDDLGELAELAAEDEEMAKELACQLTSVERRLAELEEERLFSGRFDAGDAVVTVNAGAGGTDSQDWAEMLAAHVPALGGASRLQGRDEGGVTRGGGRPQVRDLRGPGRERLRAVRRRARRPPADPHLALRLVRAPAYELRPGGGGAAGRGRRRGGDRRRRTSASTPIAPRVPAGQHVNKTDSAVRVTHVPTGIVAQSQNERSQIQNRATAMQILRSRLLERKELEQAEELAKERGEQKSAEWGSQIRSYFLHPDQRVKDHRTNFEVGDTNRVLDGDIDAFVREYLNFAASIVEELAQTCRCPDKRRFAPRSGRRRASTRSRPRPRRPTAPGRGSTRPAIWRSSSPRASTSAWRSGCSPRSTSGSSRGR